MANSAIPNFYFAMFAIYEPLLTVVGFLGALLDPKKTHDSQAPWPAGIVPPGDLPRATQVTVVQLAHVCGLLGVVNAFILRACRRHLAFSPAIQEKIVRALLTPLLIGDVAHLGVTFWALGDSKWDLSSWTPLLWTTFVLGFSLLIPRAMWHLGIWRYVDGRDRIAVKNATDDGNRKAS